MLSINSIIRVLEQEHSVSEEIDKIKIIQTLSQESTKTSEGFIRILDFCNKIKYCNAEQFCEYIAKYIEEQSAKQFKKIFMQSDKRYKKNAERILQYPIINDEQEDVDEHFVRKKIERFIVQYQNEEQYFKDEKFGQIDNPNFSWGNHHQQIQTEIIKQQESKLENNQTSQLKEQQKNQQLVYEVIQQINQQIRQQAKQQKQYIKQFSTKICQPNEIISLGYVQEKSLCAVHKQYLGRKSLSTLLALNVTKQFEKQLLQIKQLIKEQLFHGTKVIQAYEQFLLEYIQFHYLNEGKCQQYQQKQVQQIKNNIQSYFQEMSFQNGKKIKPYWDKMFVRLKEQLKVKQSNDLREEIKKILIKPLQNNNDIYLTFTYAKKIYGCTFSSTIFININQMGQNLQFQKFILDPLKSYLALILYHQLAHWLLRKTKICQLEVGDCDKSFLTKSPSVGNRIITEMRLRYKHIPQQFRLRNKILHQDAKQNFQEKCQIINKILQTHKQLFQSLQQCKEQLKNIKSFLLPFNRIFRILHQQIQYTRIKPQWRNIYNYIDQLVQKPTNQIQDQPLSAQQIKYRFFFSLFLTEPIAKKWLKKIKQDQHIYQKYKNKLTNLKTRQYFIGKNQIVQQILKEANLSFLKNKIQNEYQKLNYTLESDQHVLTFIDNILFKQYPLQQLRQKVCCIYQKINKQKLFDYGIKSSRYETNISVGGPFKKLQIKSFIKKNQITILSSLIQNQELEDALQLIFNAEILYQKFNKILDYSEYLIIAADLPSFFTNNTDSFQRNFQSGYDIERRLFLKPQIETIYAKDYKLMREIEQKNTRHLIGVQPKDESQKKSSIMVRREGFFNKDEGISLKRGYCGNHYNYLMKVAAQNFKKQRLQQKLKKIAQ